MSRTSVFGKEYASGSAAEAVLFKEIDSRHRLLKMKEEIRKLKTLFKNEISMSIQHEDRHTCELQN